MKEEDDTDPSKEYIDGFNQGYLLAKHDPNLYVTIIESTQKGLDKNDYGQGLIAGGLCHEKEKQIAQEVTEIDEWENKVRVGQKGKPDQNLDY